jgi:hypothetical protein
MRPSDVNKLAAEKFEIALSPLCPAHRRAVASLSAIKLRVRNVRRLQLSFLNQFYEHIQLDMHYQASSPRRNQSSPRPRILRPVVCLGNDEDLVEVQM